jgi:hypothetical protein
MGGEMPGSNITTKNLFVTIVRTELGRRVARSLIKSLRNFGGKLADSPIWVFEANPEKAPCQSLGDLGATVQSLSVPDVIKSYLFADKVCACSLAEEHCGEGISTLVWMDPSMLVTAPPLEFICDPPIQAAFRPVHIQNIGSLRSEPPDAYWQGVYRSLGVKDVELSVESFVDARPLRAYFNTHAFAVNPQQRILRQWLVEFEKLVLDEKFQAATCQDEAHQVFLHQAVLSTLLAVRIDAERIRILPPTYNYPYNLQQRVPEVRRAKRLNDLATAVIHEEGFVDLTKAEDIQIDEPLRTWLQNETREL